MTRAEAHGQGKRAAGLDPHRRGQRYCLPEKSPDFFCIFTFLPCRCSSLRLVKPVSRWRSVATKAHLFQYPHIAIDSFGTRRTRHMPKLRHRQLSRRSLWTALEGGYLLNFLRAGVCATETPSPLLFQTVSPLSEHGSPTNSGASEDREQRGGRGERGRG